MKLIYLLFQRELEALEGVKCKVPFHHEWSGLSYHNAIVIGSEIAEDDSVNVQVVFMHPTSKKMKPCPYYLEGTCKYADEKCHYSHGFSVPLTSIQDYRYTRYCKLYLKHSFPFNLTNRDPDYEQIMEGSAVLAKYKDALWYRGYVESVVKHSEFSVKFLHNNDVLLLDLHSIFPLGNSGYGICFVVITLVVSMHLSSSRRGRLFRFQQ